MDMRDMSDIGSLFGTGKDEQRTSPEEPGWCNTYRGASLAEWGIDQRFVL